MTATLHLRDDALTEHRTREGLTSDRALARAAGINPSNLHRVLKGTQEPGARFIASLVAVFPGLGVDDLFRVVKDTTTDAAA